MEEEYWGCCEVCDVETRVTVINEEQKPFWCPMCGSDVEFENTSEE